ncbi:MAG TPA: DNA-binding protein [Streptomyces sp.]|nr:DNA-binding protein [Streptomyces sp.]
MGEIGDSLERADRHTFTRRPPQSTQARVRYLLTQVKTTRAAAGLLGVSQRSVERYLQGTRRNPPRAVADRLEAEVRRRWQPRVRRRAQQQAATATGITVETRARFGFTAAPGSTDDGRIRRITQHLPAAYAQRLFDAREAGLSEQQLKSIVAEGLQERYFKDAGRRAPGLLVEFTDIDYVELEY